MNFEQAHAAWFQWHLERRTGERRGRLERGHGHGEKLLLKNIWWDMFGHFDHLHPEYEVIVFGKRYFMDYGFIPHVRFGIEVDSYNSHAGNLDRDGFSRETRRHSYLEALGWRMLRFSYDDVNERPDVCKQIIQLALGNFKPSEAPVDKLTIVEKEIIRFGLFLARPIKPKDVSDHFAVELRTARKWLHELCARGWLIALNSGDHQRVRSYILNEQKIKYFY